MSWIGAIILQARSGADSCDGFSLPFGRCVEFDGLLGNWVSGLIAAAVLAVGGAVTKPLWRRWGRPAAGPPVLTDEIRSQMLEVARSRSWGQLRDLIGLPDGFTELHLEPRVGLVTGARTEAASVRSIETVEPGIVEAFEGSGRRLLLVGGPGSGKTVLAYKLAAYLDRRHQRDPNEPLPIVLNLTNWTSDAVSLSAWIVNQLCDPVIGLGLNDRDLATQLVTTNRLALILDGLDEVPEASRPSCLIAINTHITGRPPPPAAPLVVTCRRVEYEELITTSSPLGLLVAREPLPLDLDTVRHNLALLASADQRWTAFTRRYLNRPAAQVVEALQNPLLLSLAAETGFDPGPLLNCPDVDTVGQQICRTKVDTVLTRPDMPPTSDTWLTAIAKTNQIFQFENLTPADAPLWLGLGFGLVDGLGFGLVGGLSFGLANGLRVGLLMGLVGLLLGLLLGVSGHDARPTRHTYRMPNRRHFASEMVDGVAGGLGAGLLLGLLLGLIGWSGLSLVGGLGIGLAGGLVVGLGLGLLDSCRVDHVVRGTATPDQGMHLSRRSYIASVVNSSLVGGLSFGLAGALAIPLTGGRYGPGTALAGGLGAGLFGLAAGMVAGLNDGGGYVVLQRICRRRLRRDGIMPADPVAALEWAVRHRLMRQIGGGFQFRHNLLRDATAARETHPQIPPLELYS